MPTPFFIYENVKKEDLYVNKSEEEKENIRIMAVDYAIKHGNKPAARKYNTYPSSIRNWRKKYERDGITGLRNSKNKYKDLL